MRAWHELVAALGDLVPGGVPMLGMALLIATLLIMVLWYWSPEWWRGLGGALVRLWRAIRGIRRRRRHTGEPDEAYEAVPEELDDEVPEVPAAALLSLADDLAAQGRFKEAVRERLRAIVRDLIERQVIEHRPGWTVTELAIVAGLARPPAAGPLRAASDIFSGIWYGQRTATAADDAAMRNSAGQVRAALDVVGVSA